MECGEHYRGTGLPELVAAGETEWVHRLAIQARDAPAGVARIAGIVGKANLALGEPGQPLLEAHMAASTLFRGVRDNACWGEGDGVHQMAGIGHAKESGDAGYRAGVKCLGAQGLVFDAANYHTQILGLRDLARAVPETTMVVNHLATPLGVGPYADRRDEISPIWSGDMTQLAECENVRVKLGGMAIGGEVVASGDGPDRRTVERDFHALVDDTGAPQRVPLPRL